MSDGSLAEWNGQHTCITPQSHGFVLKKICSDKKSDTDTPVFVPWDDLPSLMTYLTHAWAAHNREQNL